MFQINKKNLLNFEHLNNTPLLPSNSKGEDNKLRIKKIKQRVILKKKKRYKWYANNIWNY